MLITFMFGALCVWLFIVAADIRYNRKLNEFGLKVLIDKQEVLACRERVAAVEEQLEAKDQMIEALEEKTAPKLQKRIDELYDVIDKHADRLRDEKVISAKLQCEIVKLKERFNISNEDTSVKVKTPWVAGGES